MEIINEMEGIYKCLLNEVNINEDKINIPKNCKELQISYQKISYRTLRNRPHTSNKGIMIALSRGFIDFLGKSKIEILDMRECECIEEFFEYFGSETKGLFRNLYHLKAVWLPESLKIMPRFNNCPNLSFVSAENVERINNYSFVKCPNLVEIKWGNNVKYFHSNAFKETGITHFVFPHNSSEFLLRSFSGCSTLRSIYLPDDIEKLSDFMFANCTNLVKVDGGRNIKWIEKGTFKGCKKLKYLSFHPRLIDSSFFTLLSPYREDDSYSGKGIVLCEIDNDAIIWDIKEYKFYCGEAHGLTDKLVEYDIANKVDVSYVEEGIILNRTYKAVEIRDPRDYRSIEHPALFRAFVNEITHYVNSLDMNNVIDNYETEIYERITTKVGGDDMYDWKVTRKTSTTDSYINKILPPFYEGNKERGYTTFSYMSNERRHFYENEGEKIKQNARKIYNKENHIDDIIDNHIQSLVNENINIEKSFRLNHAKDILDIFLKRNPYWNNHYDALILTDNLNDMLNTFQRNF